jgi:hypothetical protein
MAEEQAAVNQQFLQALQAITQQCQAQANAIAAIAAAPQAGQAAAVAGAPTVFAETPAKINANAIIDYSTAAGIKLYNTASAKLPVTFDITSQTANLFCDPLTDRANKSGWYTGEGNILMIPDSLTMNRDLIKEYCRLSLDDIKAHVSTYITGNSRRTQNSAQMLSCIKELLSDAGKLKILSEVDKWKVDDKESGVLLFKVIMQKAMVDARATSSFFRENLTSLVDSYITTIDSNIELFNQYVNINRAGLQAHGEKTDDLIINLFKAYLNVTDQHFVEYMKKKKDDYDEGTTVLEPETLMTHALNKYHILVQEHKWKSMSPQDEQLVALKAQYEQLHDANLRLARSITGKKSTKYAVDKKKAKGQKGKNQLSKQSESWKKEPPKEDDPLTKTVNNKTYNWCPHHLAWTFHSEDDCQL